jgi:hypothetical protein
MGILTRPPFAIALIAAALLAGGWAASAPVVESGSFYKVTVTTSGANGSMVAKVVVTGKKGYHPNKDYPWRLTIQPSKGVTLAKTEFRSKRGDGEFTKKAATFSVPYTAARSAEKVKAELKLSLCNGGQCQMKLVKLTWPAR